jgi:hypothetical protein
MEGTLTAKRHAITYLCVDYKRYARDQSSEDRVAYAHAEGKAQAERRGLWRSPARATVGVPQAVTRACHILGQCSIPAVGMLDITKGNN